MEFGMRHNAGQPQGVDWYTPSTAGGGYGSYNTGAGAYGGGASTSGYGTTDNFEDEPPLLEELGIDIGAIFGKTRALLKFQTSARSLEDLDMGGALVLVFVLGGLHLLMGKLHFGVILGWSVVHSALLWFLLNQLAGGEASEAKGLDLYSCCCVVGYCLFPVCLYSAAALVLPRGLPSAVLAMLSAAWAALICSRIFARRCPALEELKAIIMFPCLLAYGAFALLSAY